MLLTKNVEAPISNCIKYYTNLGYTIPKDCYNENGRIIKGSKITVNVSDLRKGSHVKIIWKCDKCNNIFEEEYKQYIKHKHDKYGKEYCVRCSASVFNSKENHYLWRKDLSEKDREYREHRQLDPKYTLFIRTVMKRDKATCQICGCSDSGNMVIHHLESYNINKELSTEISNGICLCKYCHDNFHRLYGKGNNTKEQFIEWSKIQIDSIINKSINPIEINALYCIEDNEIIYNIADYARTHDGVYSSSLNKCCKGLQSTVNGKHYMYYVDFISKNKNEIEEYIKMLDSKWSRTYDQYEKMKNSNGFKKICKKIVCIEKKILLDKMSEAKLIVPIKSMANLTVACKDNNKTAYGYHWCYLEDYKGDISELKKVGND